MDTLQLEVGMQHQIQAFSCLGCGCDENGECIVDYDPREGVLFAETGSENLVGK